MKPKTKFNITNEEAEMFAENGRVCLVLLKEGKRPVKVKEVCELRKDGEIRKRCLDCGSLTCNNIAAVPLHFRVDSVEKKRLLDITTKEVRMMDIGGKYPQGKSNWIEAYTHSFKEGMEALYSGKEWNPEVFVIKGDVV